MRLSIYLIAVLFVSAGSLHWLYPEFFMRIMPPYFPYPRHLVLLTGAIEIVLGTGVLIEKTRRQSGWGLILLLIAVFPANYYMLQRYDLFHSIPRWLLLWRLPLQAALIFWVYRATVK